MPRRQCLGCGRIFAAGRGRRASRCRSCLVGHPHEGAGPWRAQARAAVAAWVAEHGYVCPGWGREGHAADPGRNPLTADHVVPASAGGTAADGIRILCRECNSRRGAREKEEKR